MTDLLHVAESLGLPLDLATRKTSLVAKSGAGKSYGLRKITEAIVQANRSIPGALVDPLGVMYGLRFAPDGVSPGLGIPIIGGAHGDVPVRESSGPAVARALVHGDTVAILDISHLDDEEQWEFVKGFTSALTRELMARKRAFWLAIDEADLFAPETPMKGQLECQRAVRHYCRRARNFGGGYTFATQSTSVIDKKVVGQSDLIIAMRVTSPTDQAPILDWLKAGIGKERALEIVGTLASFKTGEAWFYSPEWLGIVERHRILPCDTFDSSKTPEVGEVIETTGKGAPIDLDSLRANFESDVDESEEDVATLHARIAELEYQLRTPAPAAEPQIIEKAVIRDDQIEKLSALANQIQEQRDQWFGISARVVGELNVAASELAKSVESVLNRMAIDALRANHQRREHTPEERIGRDEPANAEIEKGARGLLEVLVQRHPMKMTRAQLATLSGRSIKSSSFGPHVRQMVAAGYAEDYGDILAASPKGLAFIGKSASTPQSSADVAAMWLSKLPKGPARMLEALLRHRSRRFSRDTLATESGMSPTSSAIGANIKILRDNGLIDMVGDGIQLGEVLA